MNKLFDGVTSSTLFASLPPRYWNTRQAAHSYLTRLPLTSLTHTHTHTHPHTHTHIAHIAHTYQFPSSPWASALDRYMVSALGSRVGWTPAHKERTNEQTNKKALCLGLYKLIRRLGVLGIESPILGNVAPPEAQNPTNRRPFWKYVLFKKGHRIKGALVRTP